MSGFLPPRTTGIIAFCLSTNINSNSTFNYWRDNVSKLWGTRFDARLGYCVSWL